MAYQPLPFRAVAANVLLAVENLVRSKRTFFWHQKVVF